MTTKDIPSQITSDKIHSDVQWMISQTDINILVCMVTKIAVYDEN